MAWEGCCSCSLLRTQFSMQAGRHGAWRLDMQNSTAPASSGLGGRVTDTFPLAMDRSRLSCMPCGRTVL